MRQQRRFARLTRLAALVPSAVLVPLVVLLLTACSAVDGSVTATVTVTRTSTSTPAPGITGAAGSVGTTIGSDSAGADPGSGTAGSPDGSASTAASSMASTPPTTSSPAPSPVHVSTFEGDGKTYGIGMAVVALFSVPPTDSTAFTKAAIVTVNGKPANGAWFWQKPTLPGYALEGLYREKGYWPAHASIEVDLPVDGLSAGPGLVFDDSLAVTFSTGAAHVSKVNNASHTMVVTSDDSIVKTVPVSLGSATTPTYDGTKVVMEKDNPERMVSEPGDKDPYNLLVPWSVRLTNSGEFIHAASWNTGNIGSRNTSHGCTNLDVADAKWFYNFSLIGDVVEYPDANPDGKVQPSWDGWGWWNISWPQWSRGGMLLNH